MSAEEVEDGPGLNSAEDTAEAGNPDDHPLDDVELDYEVDEAEDDLRKETDVARKPAPDVEDVAPGEQARDIRHEEEPGVNSLGTSGADVAGEKESENFGSISNLPDHEDDKAEPDEELEEGEVSDEDQEARKERLKPLPVCRFYSKGQCTWGTSCRFKHPGVLDKGNYSMFGDPKPILPGAEAYEGKAKNVTNTQVR